MGKSTVFVNGQGMSSSNSGAISISGPDVCLTPVGNTQVPVPYTNIARSATLANGSKTVTINGGMGAIDGCCYNKSTGDEPGSGKGVGSGTVSGKAEFINSSFNVMVEGRGACRNSDAMALNNKNALGINHDSCRPAPAPEEEALAKGTLRFKVVEHLSWDAYDKKTKTFRIGHRDNNPIAGKKFKIRMPDGSVVEKTTDANGVIELTDQDPSAMFEIAFAPDTAALNNKDFLFYNSFTVMDKRL